MTKRAHQRAQPQKLKQALADVTTGLEHLHKALVAHNDIKAHNMASRGFDAARISMPPSFEHQEATSNLKPGRFVAWVGTAWLCVKASETEVTASWW